MDKTAIIDIDNTLWQFCDPLYDRMSKINPDVPLPQHWTDWYFFTKYCSQAEFLQIIDDIHDHQDNDDHIPYPEAKNFLTTLKQEGYIITIATHRSPQFMTQTERWLRKHGLVYDDIHLSFHKTNLIKSTTSIVVDDSPQVLVRALQHKVMATGLLFPWNRAYCNNGFRLCHNLNEILEGILNRKG
jgi:FMN phosphatase YigB (HAD superfamily)